MASTYYFLALVSTVARAHAFSQFSRPKDESLFRVRRDRLPQTVEGNVICGVA